MSSPLKHEVNQKLSPFIGPIFEFSSLQGKLLANSSSNGHAQNFLCFTAHVGYNSAWFIQF